MSVNYGNIITYSSTESPGIESVSILCFIGIIDLPRHFIAGVTAELKLPTRAGNGRCQIALLVRGKTGRIGQWKGFSLSRLSNHLNMDLSDLRDVSCTSKEKK
jgi:hypothetical protein